MIKKYFDKINKGRNEKRDWISRKTSCKSPR